MKKEWKVIDGQLVQIGDGDVPAELERGKRVKVSIPIGFKDRPDVEFNYDHLTYYDRPLTHDEKTHYMIMAANVLLHYLNLRGVTNEKYFEEGDNE